MTSLFGYHAALTKNHYQQATALWLKQLQLTFIVINGIAARRVNHPIRIKKPQVISKLPTNGPGKSGFGNPIFSNLPGPNLSANKNFCMPSDKNTAPTIKRISKVVR